MASPSSRKTRLAAPGRPSSAPPGRDKPRRHRRVRAFRSKGFPRGKPELPFRASICQQTVLLPQAHVSELSKAYASLVCERIRLRCWHDEQICPECKQKVSNSCFGALPHKCGVPTGFGTLPRARGGSGAPKREWPGRESKEEDCLRQGLRQRCPTKVPDEGARQRFRQRFRQRSRHRARLSSGAEEAARPKPSNGTQWVHWNPTRESWPPPEASFA